MVSTVSEITMSLRQQTAAHEQVAANVETIARMSEANTGEVKRIASAAQTLAQLAQRLQGDQRIPAELSKNAPDAASGRVPWRLFFWRQMPAPDHAQSPDYLSNRLIHCAILAQAH